MNLGQNESVDVASSGSVGRVRRLDRSAVSTMRALNTSVDEMSAMSHDAIL